jgi:hypothetical protein
MMDIIWLKTPEVHQAFANHVIAHAKLVMLYQLNARLVLININ